MNSRTGWKAWPLVREGIEVAEALVGNRPARRRHRAAQSDRRDFCSQQDFIERYGHLRRTSAEEPIFILSAGWRSGSTMLQRMLMGQGQCLIWGEPYDHSDILGSLKKQWLAFTDDWPAASFFFQGKTEEIAYKWVANLYPDIQDLYDAHANLLTRLFAEPARRAGCQRWGVKEVRWTVDDAHFLHWLFPRARFLFLCRNPFNAWRSYRESRCWYLRWPEEPILTPYRFGRLWARLAQDFKTNYRGVDGRFLHYEDLLATQGFEELECYLGLNISSPQDVGRIRSRKPGKELARTPVIEDWLLKFGCGDARERLGY